MPCRLHLIILLTLKYAFCEASEAPPITTDNDRISYSLGHQVGRDFKRQGVSASPDALLQGLKDAYTGTEPLLSPQDMHSLLVDLKKQIQAAQSRKKRQRAEELREEGRAFLAKNAKEKNVKTLPSGLQYKIIRKGHGKAPKPNDTVTVHYRGTLIGGREFDSSYRAGEPEQYRVDSVMPGWTEALQKMHAGARWQLFIPTELGYHRRGPLANRTLIYDIELIAINKATKQQTGKGAQ